MEGVLELEVEIKRKESKAKEQFGYICPVCGEKSGVIKEDRRKCRKVLVKMIKRHMKYRHEINPDEYRIVFEDWF